MIFNAGDWEQIFRAEFVSVDGSEILPGVRVVGNMMTFLQSVVAQKRADALEEAVVAVLNTMSPSNEQMKVVRAIRSLIKHP